MDLIGQCYICGRPAFHTCSICGQLICEEHYDAKAKMCTNDSPTASKNKEKVKWEEDKLLH
jgi:hypothetical protein